MSLPCPNRPMLSCLGLALALVSVALGSAPEPTPEVALVGKDLGPWQAETGDWMIVGKVAMDPANGQLLVTEPGVGVLLNGKTGRTKNLLSKHEHGDVEAHVEFMVPQGSNSGVYLQGRYEIQIYDSWGVKELRKLDCGAIYERFDEKKQIGWEGHAPRVNASLAPGQWQTFDVVFQAPRFDASGKKTANAKFIKVVHNGKVIHENVEVSGPTRAATYEDEKPLGPLMLQGDHGPVAYRNIVLRPITAAPAASGGAEHADLPANDAVKPELFAEGFEFAEGPALNAAGDLFVVNYHGNGNIGRIAADGTASVFCDLRKLVAVEGKKPQANGLKIDRQGRLIASDSGVGRLLRVAADGKSAEVLAEAWEGNHFRSLNDVALDLEGNIYFSDPGGSSAKEPNGSIYRYDAKTAKVTRLATDLAYPNGLAVTPDQKRLCLSESDRHRVLIFDLAPGGELSNRRVLIEFPVEPTAINPTGEYVPDGMIFDAKGRLFVATWTGGVIRVIEVPSGRLLRQYDAGGSRATNCHFHGGYLYVTVAAKQAVFRLKLGLDGFDYHGAAIRQ